MVAIDLKDLSPKSKVLKILIKFSNNKNRASILIVIDSNLEIWNQKLKLIKVDAVAVKGPRTIDFNYLIV